MMIKKMLYIVLLVLLVLCSCCRSWFPGIFYPSKNFWFKEMGERGSLGVGIVSGSGINSFKKCYILTATSTHKQYKILRIKKMLYKWEGNTGDFLMEPWLFANDAFSTRDFLTEDGYYERQLFVNDAFSKDGYYEYRFFYFLEFNPEKFFKSKKIGDEFKFYLTIVYSFDDEPDITQIIEYNASVTKGRYQSFWSGFG